MADRKKKTYIVRMETVKGGYPEKLEYGNLETYVEDDDIIGAILLARDDAYNNWSGVTVISAEEIVECKRTIKTPKGIGTVPRSAVTKVVKEIKEKK